MKEFVSKNATVLFVDDEVNFLETIKLILSGVFLEIHCAKSATEALKMLKNHNIDLLVCDYQMPEMNGLELIEIVKSNYPFIPILMLTANGRHEDVIEALRVGAFDVVDKPVCEEVLINRMQNALILPELLLNSWEYVKHSLSIEQLELFSKMSIKEQMHMLYVLSKMEQLRKDLKKG